ncbi:MULTISPECIES: hypothetical protein [unclassified Streptomyces]|uniref:hypothetical protein n=1 Tax=unclassified Streptomyces TaxID=2593676 RepID=UPI00278C8A48|nr:MULTISPECIES: hypothetical protein [unclassified Streptomyces]
MSISYGLDFADEDLLDAWLAVPILEGRGAGRTRRKWAKTVSALHCALLSGAEGRSKAQVKEYARVLERISEQFPQRIPMQHLFAYAPDLDRTPLPFFFYAVESAGPVEPVLDALVQRNEPGAMQDPHIVDFSTESLGRGLRSVRRFVHKASGAPGISVNYGWRVDSLGIDLSLRTVSDEIDWVSANIGAFDAFVRNLRLVRQGAGAVV